MGDASGVEESGRRLPGHTTTKDSEDGTATVTADSFSCAAARVRSSALLPFFCFFPRKKGAW